MKANKCIDCGKQISQKKARRCGSCAQLERHRNYRHPMLGRKHTGGARRKMSEAKERCYEKMSLEERQQKFGKQREKHPRWTGGRHHNDRGYVLVHAPEHPRARKSGHVMEHRLVIEEHLGRYLEPWELVHHKNRIKDDNRIENLELFPRETDHLVLKRMEVELNTQKKKIRKWQEAYFRLLVTSKGRI